MDKRLKGWPEEGTYFECNALVMLVTCHCVAYFHLDQFL